MEETLLSIVIGVLKMIFLKHILECFSTNIQTSGQIILTALKVLSRGFYMWYIAVFILVYCF